MITAEQIITEARTWKGTPFMGHVRVKGIGCDCVGLVVGVLMKLGAIPKDIALPAYTLGSGSHMEYSLVCGWIENSGLFTAEAPAQPGDIVGLKLGRVVHHVGIVTSEATFIHAVEKHGVIESRLDAPPWENRVKSIWRLKQ